MTSSCEAIHNEKLPLTPDVTIIKKMIFCLHICGSLVGTMSNN
eukprot:COSAG02_NODE_66_length_42609_cov_95.996848_28_plen_43_part_00